MLPEQPLRKQYRIRYVTLSSKFQLHLRIYFAHQSEKKFCLSTRILLINWLKLYLDNLENFFLPINIFIITIISWNFKISHICIKYNAILLRIEIISSWLIDLNFPLPIDICHLPSPYNFLKIVSRSIQEKIENNRTTTALKTFFL